MQSIFAVTIPFFALVLGGWLAARRHVLPEEAIPGLNAFVLYFALPCMLFRFGANQPLADLLNPAVIVVYLVCALVVVAFTIAVTLGPEVPLRDAAFGALVAAFPNSGFMGVPLVVAMLGPAASGPVMSSLLVDLILTSSLCVGLAQAHAAVPARRHAMAMVNATRPGRLTAPGELDALGGTRTTLRAGAWRALKGALTNPLPWAIAAGAAWRLTGLSLPGPVDQVVRMLGDAATPVALFTIGAVLWRSGRPRYAAFEDAEWKSTGGTLHRPQPRRAAEAAEAAKPERERRRKPGAVPLGRYLPVAAIKLFLHPLLVLLFCAAAHQLGAPLTVLQISALVLAAALPSAANVSLLAERYGADNGRIAHIIMASTAASFVTLSTLAWLLGARPQL